MNLEELAIIAEFRELVKIAQEEAFSEEDKQAIIDKVKEKLQEHGVTDSHADNLVLDGDVNGEGEEDSELDEESVDEESVDEESLVDEEPVLGSRQSNKKDEEEAVEKQRAVKWRPQEDADQKSNEEEEAEKQRAVKWRSRENVDEKSNEEEAVEKHRVDKWKSRQSVREDDLVFKASSRVAALILAEEEALEELGFNEDTEITSDNIDQIMDYFKGVVTDSDDEIATEEEERKKTDLNDIADSLEEVLGRIRLVVDSLGGEPEESESEDEDLTDGEKEIEAGIKAAEKSILIDNIANELVKYAKEFEYESEYDKYLKDHPKADPSDHSYKSKGKPADQAQEHDSQGKPKKQRSEKPRKEDKEEAKPEVDPEKEQKQEEMRDKIKDYKENADDEKSGKKPSDGLEDSHLPDKEQPHWWDEGKTINHKNKKQMRSLGFESGSSELKDDDTFYDTRTGKAHRFSDLPDRVKEKLREKSVNGELWHSHKKNNLNEPPKKEEKGELGKEQKQEKAPGKEKDFFEEVHKKQKDDHSRAIVDNEESIKKDMVDKGSTIGDLMKNIREEKYQKTDEVMQSPLNQLEFDKEPAKKKKAPAKPKKSPKTKITKKDVVKLYDLKENELTDKEKSVLDKMFGDLPKKAPAKKKAPTTKRRVKPTAPAQKKKRVKEIEKEHKELADKPVDLTDENDPVSEAIHDLHIEKQELTQPDLPGFGEEDAPAKKAPVRKKKRIKEIEKEHKKLENKKVDLTDENDPVIDKIHDLHNEKKDLVEKVTDKIAPKEKPDEKKPSTARLQKIGDGDYQHEGKYNHRIQKSGGHYSVSTKDGSKILPSTSFKSLKEVRSFIGDINAGNITYDAKNESWDISKLGKPEEKDLVEKVTDKIAPKKAPVKKKAPAKKPAERVKEIEKEHKDLANKPVDLTDENDPVIDKIHDLHNEKKTLEAPKDHHKELLKMNNPKERVDYIKGIEDGHNVYKKFMNDVKDDFVKQMVDVKDDHDKMHGVLDSIEKSFGKIVRDSVQDRAYEEGARPSYRPKTPKAPVKKAPAKKGGKITLGPKKSNLDIDGITADLLIDSITDRLVESTRGLQTVRKDKDTMEDTGGSSKGREREPQFKPPRDDVKKRYRTKKLKPDERDPDTNGDKDLR